MRVIAAATDAGGAANIAPVAALFTPQERRVFCSAATERYFRDAGVDDVTPWDASRSVEHEIAAWDADAVVCGTTRYESPDRLFVAAARVAGVRSVVVLDEWSWYAHRFRREGADQLTYLPDAVCVPDAFARNEAAHDGLPLGRMIVTGSPALASLCDRIDRFLDVPPELPDVLAGAPHPWIVFVSETHAQDFGSAPGARGPFGAFLGYTERSVATSLAASLLSIGRPCTVIEKLHPAATGDPGPLHLAPKQLWRVAGRMPVVPLLWHADLVVGMRSMALLEAALCGRPVVSYQPGLLPDYEPATGERLGFVDSAKTEDELIEWLRARWDGAPHRRPSRPAFAAAGAAASVRDVACALCAR